MPSTLPFTFKLTLLNRLKMSMAGLVTLLLGIGVLFSAYPTKDLASIAIATIFVLIGIGLFFIMFSRPKDVIIVSENGIFLAYAAQKLQTTIPWDDILGFSKVTFRGQEMMLIKTESAKVKAEQDAMNGITQYALGMLAKGAEVPGITIPDMWLGMKVDKAIEILEAIRMDKQKNKSI